MTKKLKSFWYRDDAKGINLTPAEAEIMRVVWDMQRPVTVRDVYEILLGKKRIAYTTVMSMMAKLARKGVLKQDNSSTAYLYSPTLSDTDVAESMLEGVIDKVLAGAAEPIFARLLGSQKKLTAAQVDELVKLLKKKK